MNLTRVFIVIGALFLLLATIIAGADIGAFLPVASHQASEVDFLFKFMLISSAFVFLLVWGLLIYFVLRYRTRKGDNPDQIGPQSHGNTRLEITWTAIPAMFLVVLSVLSLSVWADEHTTGPHVLAAEVVGHQFFWEYNYPSLGIKSATVLHLVQNRAVSLTLHSGDVIHSFWVPALRLQQNVVPGISTYEHFTPTRAGTYPVICSEFCGLAHSQMLSTIEIDTPDQFNAWVKAQKSGGTGGQTAISFKQNIYPLMQARCSACHMGAGAFVGLVNLSTYQTVMAGGHLAGGGVMQGPIVVSGKHTNSYLWQVVAGVQKVGARMPLGGPYLAQNQLDLVAKWIDQGAKNN